MQVINTHARVLAAPPSVVGALIDGLASSNDQLWPRTLWPAMRLDRPLGVGAAGGHGTVRYVVEAYTHSRFVRFRFSAPRGFDGTHACEVESTADGCTLLRHTIQMRAAGWAMLSWLLCYRPLHDALIEDLLDRAERAVGTSRPERRWSLAVRFLRHVLRRYAGQSG